MRSKPAFDPDACHVFAAALPTIVVIVGFGAYFAKLLSTGDGASAFVGIVSFVLAMLVVVTLSWLFVVRRLE